MNYIKDLLCRICFGFSHLFLDIFDNSFLRRGFINKLEIIGTIVYNKSHVTSWKMFVFGVITCFICGFTTFMPLFL